jgi:hypothetical protein
MVIVDKRCRVNDPSQLFGDRIEDMDDCPKPTKLVEDGHITADNFGDFTLANAVKLWGTQNPHFFEGTRVAKEAAAVLAAPQTPTLAAAE